MEINIMFVNLSGVILEGVNFCGISIGLSVCLIINYIGCVLLKVIFEVK